MCSPSLLITCPYQINLLSVIFLEACATLVVPRMCSFLILYLRVTPHIRRSIPISVTSIRLYCLFVVAHASAPYSIAGLITVLYTFPLASFCRTVLRRISSNFSSHVHVLYQLDIFFLVPASPSWFSRSPPSGHMS